MKCLRPVAAGLVLLVTGVMNPVAAQAAAVSGNVMLGTKSAQAVVAAVPFDSSTGTIDADRAVTVFTGLNGRFTITPPSEQFMLVAWNGEEGAIILDPTDGQIVHLQTLALPTYAPATTYCSCRRLFWNLYWTCMWTDVLNLGCGPSWGCGC
ncbi:MAG: hypothetical protein HY420_02055 [Candidatus Kerfeldbacteria bacterium]|nr:hypothetical protein [Candidatus Kerfeldbacteria bacterium]